LIKPLTEIQNSGFAVRKFLVEHFPNEESFQMLVVHEDIHTLPGAVSIHEPSDLKQRKEHAGLLNLQLQLPGVALNM
jgi:peptidyl-tRNA hydrolase